MTVKFYFKGMKSMWLCVDPSPSIDLKKHSHTDISGVSTQNRKIPSQNSPYFGIYKDLPTNIGKRIKRPLTPFSHSTDNLAIPAPTFNQSNVNYKPGFGSIICAPSPSVNEKFEKMNDSSKNGYNFNVISIF